jgi:hypothetical protein
VLLTPWVWRSRRNNREGALLALGGLAGGLAAGAWVTVYLLCAGRHLLVSVSIKCVHAERYGNHWEDIAACGGLVATGALIIIVIFLPKVPGTLQGPNTSWLPYFIQNVFAVAIRVY